MLVLALDTTTRAGSVALTRDDNVLALVSGDPAKTHAERLPGALMRALDEQHVALGDVDVFAVAAGPGSFTGLRIGIATIQGLAFSLRRRVVGVSALDALAEVAREAGAHSGMTPADRDGSLRLGACPYVAAWMDAQRGEVFAALYPTASSTPIDGPVSERPASVIERWRRLTGDQPIAVAGDGITRYRVLLLDRLGAAFRAVEPLPPLAPTIARMAARDAAEGHAVAPHAIRPIYVRRPDAELARDSRR